MEIVIGLGGAGCRIADEFAKNPQYETYKIDEGVYTGILSRNSFSIAKQKTHQQYELQTPDLGAFLGHLRGEVLFVLGGSGNISGCALRVLEQIRHCKINVLYIEPDIELLIGDKKLQERATYYILQEFARSGLLERMYIVSNPQIEKILDNVPIIGYNDKLNELIISTFHMINVYHHIDSVADNFVQPDEIARISTIGISNLENEKKLFFSLDNIKEMVYYYAINKNKLETDGNLMKKITENIKMENEVKVSYGIFATDYPDDYVYCTANSSFIQFRENEIKALQFDEAMVE